MTNDVRLIDANALNQKFEEREAEDIELYGVHIAECFPADAAKEIVDQTPTIDPKSLRPTGRWEWQERWETHPETRSCDLVDCGWYCTECGIELGEYLSKKTGQHIILDDDFVKPKLASCPNCGAKMEG